MAGQESWNVQKRGGIVNSQWLLRSVKTRKLVDSQALNRTTIPNYVNYVAIPLDHILLSHPIVNFLLLNNLMGTTTYQLHVPIELKPTVCFYL